MCVCVCVMLDTPWCSQWGNWRRCHYHHSLRHYFVFYFKFEFLDGSAAAWAARHKQHRSYNQLQRAVGGDNLCHPVRSFRYVVNATAGQPRPSDMATLCPAVRPTCAHPAMFGTLLLTVRDIDYCHIVSPAMNHQINITRCFKPSFSLSVSHWRPSFRTALSLSFTSVNWHLV